jgi:hypothetical protein
LLNTTFKRSAGFVDNDTCLKISDARTALLNLFQLGLIAQNRVHQRTVNLDMPVVADQAELAKLVHEMTDAGAGRTDHFGQRFLTDVRADWLRSAFLPEIR